MRPSPADFDWIFFDCFNTLIDDFDPHGEEHGLVSLPELAVELGYFASPDAFTTAYLRVRREQHHDGRETLFTDRLTRVLTEAAPDRPAAAIANAVARFCERWEHEYDRHIRPTPGVHEMLAHWAPRKAVGVVSNFFLPGYPQRYLQRFGLLQHFRFVVDSAGFGYRKPHPRIFHHALAQAGLASSDSHRVLYIGDRHDLDVAPATALGMRVIHFNRGRHRNGVDPTPAHIAAIHDWAEFR